MARRISSGQNLRNAAFLVAGIAVAILILRTEWLHAYILHLNKLDYIGALLAGCFFVSTFTIAPASIVLFILAETMPLWVLALLAGLGAMIGDFTIFQFIKNDDLAKEMYVLFKQLGGKKLRHLLHSKHFHWMLPVVGALIIISPLPDELGVSLMGISKLKTRYFLLLSFLLNTAGVFLLLSASIFFKP